jgi:hypothetical protein
MDVVGHRNLSLQKDGGMSYVIPQARVGRFVGYAMLVTVIILASQREITSPFTDPSEWMRRQVNLLPSHPFIGHYYISQPSPFPRTSLHSPSSCSPCSRTHPSPTLITALRSSSTTTRYFPSSSIHCSSRRDALRAPPRPPMSPHPGFFASQPRLYSMSPYGPDILAGPSLTSSSFDAPIPVAGLNAPHNDLAFPVLVELQEARHPPESQD